MTDSIGHGWVTPRPDGAKAKCGGPAICAVCARELAAQQAEQQAGDEQALVDALTEATMAGARLAAKKIATAIRRQRQGCPVHRGVTSSATCIPCVRDAAYEHATRIAESGRIEEHGG